MSLSGATTSCQSGPGSDVNEGVLCIPRSLPWALPWDCLVSHLGHSLGEFYPSAEMQSVYSAALADWVRIKEGNFVNYQLNYLTEFDMYIDIVQIVYSFMAYQPLEVI